MLVSERFLDSLIMKMLKFFLIFLWAITVNVQFGGYVINLSLISNTLLSLLFIFTVSRNFGLLRKFILFNLTWLCVVTFLVLVTYIRASVNDAFLSTYFISLIIFFLVYACAIGQLVIICKSDVFAVLRFFVYALALNSLLVIFSVINFEYISWIYDYIYVTEKQSRYLFGEVVFSRYSGLAVSGFSSLSVANAFAIGIGLYLLITKQCNKKLMVLCIAAMFISNIWIGRSGIILACFYIGIYGLNLFSVDKYKFFMRTGHALILGFIVVSLIPFDINFDRIRYAFEIFYAVSAGEESETLNILAGEYKLGFSTDSYQLLFGSGNLDYGRGSLFTDVGVVNILHITGIIGLFVFFAPYFWVYLFKVNNLYLRIMYYSMPVIVISLNLKDTYLVGNTPSFKFFLLLLIFHILSSEKYYDAQKNSRFNSALLPRR